MKTAFIIELILIFVILYSSLMYLSNTVRNANNNLNNVLEKQIITLEKEMGVDY